MSFVCRTRCTKQLIKLVDAFWAELTPERAFLARVFVAYCISTKDNTRLEEVLPVVTSLAFRIQGTYNALLEDIQSDAEHEDEDGEEERHKREDERMDREFVIGEMLRLAVDLDYADEIGRRKMFQLVRECLRLPTHLPSSELRSSRRYDWSRSVARESGSEMFGCAEDTLSQ